MGREWGGGHPVHHTSFSLYCRHAVGGDIFRVVVVAVAVAVVVEELKINLSESYSNSLSIEREREREGFKRANNVWPGRKVTFQIIMMMMMITAICPLKHKHTHSLNNIKQKEIHDFYLLRIDRVSLSTFFLTSNNKKTTTRKN